MHWQRNRSRRKSICFVSETGRSNTPLEDPSVRYRCYHPAETLLAEGHDCTVTSAARFFNNPSLRHDIYVFHRPNIARANFTRILDALRKLGALLIADYDDLVFGDGDLALVSSAVKNGTLSEEKAINAFHSNLLGLRQFDKVTVSTAPLAERAREFNPDADVRQAANFIPRSILSIHKHKQTPFLKRSATRIGYFAGTRSHDKDFPVVEAALHRVLCENPRFTLLVVGPVTLPRSITSLSNVNTTSAVNYMRLPALMSVCATVIAPLEDSAFNLCKSRVKFLEAALSGCRLIASPIPDMRVIGRRCISFAEKTDDWYEALSAPPDSNTRTKLARRNFDLLENALSLDVFKEMAGLA